MTTEIEKIRKNIRFFKPMRTYLDAGSNEYNQTDINEKIESLASIIYFGYDLKKIVKEFKDDHNSNTSKYIYDNVIPTIKGFISFMRSGVVYDYDVLKILEKHTDKEILLTFISDISEKILPDFSIEKLILSYIESKFQFKNEEYIKQSKFFKIDLEKNLDNILSERTENEKLSTQWSYVPLYHYLKNALFSNLYDNRISDLNPEFQMPMTKGIIYFINKYYPKNIQKELINDDAYRRNKILAFIKELVEIFYFNKPMFDFNIFYIRNNMSIQKFRDEFLENSQCAIHIDQDYEIEDWDLLKAGNRSKNNTQIVVRWFNLNKSLQDKDALIVTSYKGKDQIKIGLLRKGSTYFEHKNDEYKVFQLINPVELSNKENQIFSSLIPMQTAISPIHKRKNFIISKYAGIDLSMSLENLSEQSIELICLEWLRSDCAPKHLKLQYQLLRVGGNLPNIDIYGITTAGNELCAQVSYTDNKKTIINKQQKLIATGIKTQIMFCDTDEEEEHLVETISIRKVFNDLSKNGYSKLIEMLVKQ